MVLDSRLDVSARRPHVLYLIDILWGMAGAEGALLRTVRLLPADRYRSSIGTFRLRPGLALLKDCPCPVREFPIQRVASLGALREALRLRDYIRSEKVEIVHTFFQTADLLGGLVAKLSGCPVVSSRRDMGILLSPKHRFAYRLMNPLFDRVEAVSSAVRDQAIRSGGLDPAKVVTIPNGIELAKIDAVNGSAALGKSLALGGGPVVAVVGHIRRVKGADVLIRAAARVVARYPEATFLIAGSVHEQEFGHELQALVAELGIAPNVRFLGKTGQAPALLKLCDVFCLLSRSEGMSNALLEAMACGRPSVATRVGGTPEVIEDGVTGLLVENGDDQAAAEKILSLLDDPARARRMGQAARHRVEERFSAERTMGELVRMYDGLLEGRRQGAAATEAGACATGIL
jgi:glycosyltransferase involved in cell wall biosynthesis